MILPSAYLPPISWFVRAINTNEPIFIEQHENYIKQSIRNRCTIDSPNGKLNLTIPVDKTNFTGGKCLMKDVRISSHSEWQRQHWYALETSYFNSPFFEYLQDDFHPFYEKKWQWLVDFNDALFAKCIEIMEINISAMKTEEYKGVEKHDSSIDITPYYQVFADKHGFLNDISIIDLIFNMGKESAIVIENTIKNKVIK